MTYVKKNLESILSLWISFVFIQSLFFKFTNSPETQYIFSTLDSWAAGFGFSGLFLPPGPFNQYIVGSAELIASLLLLAGIFSAIKFRAFGASVALVVISGAIFFHLFTPLGVEVAGPGFEADGGALFIMAVTVWLSSAYLILKNKAYLPILGKMTNTAD